MTPAELKAFILALAIDHPARVAFLAANDATCAALLSAKTQPGNVPTVEISRWIYDTGVYGKASVVTAAPLPADAPGQQLYGLCRTIMGMMRDLPDVNVKAVSFQQGMAVFVAIGWIDQATADQITAMGDNRLTLAAVSATQVGEARNNG